MVSSLHVSAEIGPIVNATGVGMTVSGLTTALNRQGDGARILLPGLPAILDHAEGLKPVLEMADFVGQGRAVLGIGRVQGVEADAYVLQCDALYARDGGPYADPSGAAWIDNWCRFGSLGLVAAGLSQGADPNWSPDIMQLHDWPAGLAAAYVRATDEPASPIVATIHNVERQGLFAEPRLGQLGLPETLMTPEGVEFHGHMSFLKSAIAYADWITTVSPTFSEALQSAEFGAGLEGLLSHRAHSLIGIVNGLDDPVPSEPVGGDDRAAAKTVLLGELGLDAEGEGPFVIMAGDITHRAGADLVTVALPAILDRGIRFCLAGCGEAELEDRFRELAAAYGDRIAVHIGTDPELERRLFEAGDMVLVPSRVEPCGQAQLRGLKYGTVPLVRCTGGLADTVMNAEPNHLNAGRATGFMFADATPAALLGTLHWACDTWQDQFTWQRIRDAGMAQDFTWARAALLYSRLYKKLVKDIAAMAG